MRSTLSSTLVSTLLLGLMTAAPARAQGFTPFDAPAPRIARSTAGHALTAPSNDAPLDVVVGYLRAHGYAEALTQSLEVVSRNHVTATGVTHLRMAQRVSGLQVYGVYLKATVNSRGELVSLIENLVGVAPVPAAAPGGERRALATAIQHVYGGAVQPPGISHSDGRTTFFERTAFFHREPSVTLVAVPIGGTLRAGYLVKTWSQEKNLLVHTLVDPAGSVLGVEDRTANDSYNVFTESPIAGAQTVVAGPGAGNVESPAGWLAGDQTTVNISGNNVHAYLDTDADNAPDGGGSPVAGGGFLTAANLSASPGTDGNKAVAVQNLFYLNNVMHDILYAHGFTEETGNFQESNFSSGGIDGDPVNAEAQDGSGTDNANFATPADGNSPRMQMYLWSGLGTHQVFDGAHTYLAQGASFGPALDATGLQADLVLADAGTGTTTACGRFPRGVFAGMIALIDRGDCTFADKVTNVQRAGAVAAIIANNDGDLIFTMGGSGGGIRIPSVFIGQSSGVALKASLPLSATVRLSDPAPLSIDGDLDSDIVFHEYGHGLTWRMIGGMSGVMAGAIGEGMSDVIAVLLNGDDIVGEYVAGSMSGIRTEPYATYSRTYADFGGTEVHFDGEIYGAIGWRLNELFNGNSRTTSDLLDDLVGGMNYTPSTPTFEEMRDGILAYVEAEGSSSNDTCLVWQAFADYGVGVGAKAVIHGPKVKITESFALPAECASSSVTTTARRH
jgi:extracellular elastinolytic metalloproteinase